MKKMFLGMIFCMFVVATLVFAVSAQARSVQNKAITKAKLASSYNFAKDRSLARVDSSKAYREKLNEKRLANIEKSNVQYAQKRESKVAQNKAIKMQKIGLTNFASSKIIKAVGK